MVVMAAAAPAPLLPIHGHQQEQQQLNQQQHQLAAAALRGDVPSVLAFFSSDRHGRRLRLGRYRAPDGIVGGTLFHLASMRGHGALVAALIKVRAQERQEGEKDDALMTLTPETGRSALLLASMHGHLVAVEALLSLSGTEPAVAAWLLGTPDHKGTTPLIAAAAGGHAAVVECLLWAGAAGGARFVGREDRVAAWVDARDAAGRTALYEAARFGRAAAVELLVVEGGADPTLGPSLASTPLAAVRRHQVAGGEARAACERVLEAALAEPARTTHLCHLRAQAEFLVHASMLRAATPVGDLDLVEAKEEAPPASASVLEGMVAGVVGALVDDTFVELLQYMMPAWDPKRRRDGFGCGGGCRP